MGERGLVRGLGLVTTTALVAGNMIGSGIYVIPASLADVAGPVSILVWGAVAIAYLPLTSVYAGLSAAYPVSGGLQVYAQRGFGDFAATVVSFLYWISAVISNAAFVTAFVGYFAVFVPKCGEPLPAFLLAQALLWTLTIVNVAGVHMGGAVQLATAVLKIVPLVLLAAVLFAHPDPSNLHPFAPHGLGALWPAVSLVAWLFIGAESVTVPAEEVQDAEKTIRRALYLGYAVAGVVYVAVAVSLALALPASAIAGSASPLAIAAKTFLGGWGEIVVTLGALISTLGILNGWILVVGRLPYAAGRQGLAPSWYGALHPRTGTPARGLVVSAVFTGILLLQYFSRTLLEAYNFVALAATSTALVGIAVACAAQIVLVRREPERFPPASRRFGKTTAGAGIAVALLMMVGSGLEVGGYTLLLILAPVPYYLWFRRAGGAAAREAI